ncbi:MAG: VanW family protein [Nocardioidaceae bacterium]
MGSRRWLVAGGLGVGALGLLYVGAYLFTGDRIARGTTIAGVDVGGKTAGQAVEALRDLDAATRPLTLTAAGSSLTVDPIDAGLSVDPRASVDQVTVGRSWNPRDLWEYATGGTSHEAVVKVEEASLRRSIEQLAARVDDPGVTGGITFTTKGGHPQAVASYPESGRELDTDAARELIVDAYPEHTDAPVELPVREVAPQVTREAVDDALETFAKPAMSAPVVFTIAGDRVRLRPIAYAPALSMVPEGDQLAPRLNEKRLHKAVATAMSSVAIDPTNASVKIIGGAPQVVPGKTGISYDESAITDGFLKLVVGKGKDRVLAVPTKIQTPDYTAAEVRKLGIKEQVSEFTTYYPYAEYRNINIGRAAELINGTVLKPGETFSLNKTVGERTAENGFTTGFIISNGVFKQDLGGGVSQAATTTFNAAFFAGLEDVEHKPHSFYIDRYPAGREATVAWPTVDLRFKNDTPYGVLIQAWRVKATPSVQGSMNVRMWSTKYWDIKSTSSQRYNYTAPKTRHLSGPDCEPNIGYSGFDIDVFRHFYKPGSDQQVRKEKMHTHYTPADTVICE